MFSGAALLRPMIFALALVAASFPLAAQQPPAPAAKAATAPEGAKPEPAKPATPAPGPAVAPKGDISSKDGSIKEENVAARPVIESHDAADWEEGFAKINEALAKLRAAAKKAGLKENGRPMAVFTETNDGGFKFDAMIPVDAQAGPQGGPQANTQAGAKLDLGPGISLAQSPSGKALRFEHRGAYDDIDSTYDAIAAYMDAKGLEARDLYAEEYLTDAKDSGDMNEQVDIHVFLK